MSKSLPKRITINTFDSGGNEIELVITNMPIGRYAAFLDELAKIPKSLSGVVKMLFDEKPTQEELDEFGQALVSDGETESTGDNVVDALLELPIILAKHWSSLVKLLSIASDIPEEDLEVVDLDTAVQVVIAVVDVNNFFGIRDRYQDFMVKKAIASRKQNQKMSAPTKKNRKTG